MEEIKLYKVEDLANILGVCRRTVYTYIKNGALKAKKIGRHYLITDKNLHQFIED